MSTNTKDWFSAETGEIKSFGDGSTNSKSRSSARVKLDRGAFGSVSVSFVVTKDGHWRCSAIKSILQPNNSGNNNSLANKFSLGGGPNAATTSTSSSLSPEVFQEICALRLLNPHPNIIPLYSLGQVGDSVELTFPYRADLATTLDWRRRGLLPRLAHPVILRIGRDLFSALHHCHSRGIAHLDIKPGNLLVDTGTGVVQLCDFGLAQSYPLGHEGSNSAMAKDEIAAKGMCTLYYRPPEQLFGSNAISPTFDIYSAGLLLVELVAGFPLFRGATVIGQLEATFRVMGTPDAETTDACAAHLPDFGKLQFAHQSPQELQSLIPRAEECRFLLPLLERLLAFNGALRPNAKGVLNDPFFQQQTNDQSPMQKQQQELIPTSMREPLILSNPHKNVAVATEALADLVAGRGQAAASLDKWQGGTKPFQTCKRSLRHATIYCAKSVAI